MCEVVLDCVQVMAYVLIGAFFSSLLFLHQYQERLHYRCVDADEGEELDTEEGPYREVPALLEDEECYATAKIDVN